MHSPLFFLIKFVMSVKKPWNVLHLTDPSLDTVECAAALRRNGM
jgi:hypothetical protein